MNHAKKMVFITAFITLVGLVFMAQAQDETKYRKEIVFQKELPNGYLVSLEKKTFDELRKTTPPKGSKSSGEQRVINYLLFMTPKDAPEKITPLWSKRLFIDTQTLNTSWSHGRISVYDVAIGEKSGCLLAHFSGFAVLEKFELPKGQTDTSREIRFFTDNEYTRNSSVVGGQILKADDEIICLLKFKQKDYSERWKIEKDRAVRIESIGNDPFKNTDKKEGEASPGQEKRIRELITQLMGRDSAKWKSAHDKLLEIGVPARPYIEEALGNASNPDTKDRIKKLLGQLPDPVVREKQIKESIAQLVGKDPTKWKPAHDNLLEIGLPARSHAEEAFNNASNPDAKNRIKKLLGHLPDPAAREMLLKSLVKSVRVKNYRFSAALSGSTTIKPSDGESQTIQSPSAKAEGFQKGDDFLYTKTYTMDEKGESVEEMYQRNEYIAVKKPARTKWEKVKNKDYSKINSLMMNPIGLNAFVKAFGDIRFSHTDRCQGVDCQVIELTIKGNELEKSLPKGVLGEGGEIKEIIMKYKTWVGKSDYITYKMALSMDVAGEIKDPNSSAKALVSTGFYADINITDHDKEIKTLMPDEVKKLLD